MGAAIDLQSTAIDLPTTNQAVPATTSLHRTHRGRSFSLPSVSSVWSSASPARRSGSRSGRSRRSGVSRSTVIDLDRPLARPWPARKVAAGSRGFSRDLRVEARSNRDPGPGQARREKIFAGAGIARRASSECRKTRRRPDEWTWMDVAGKQRRWNWFVSFDVELCGGRPVP
jgi:hypothetical protein